MHAGIEALASLDAPVISAVRGAAAGGGMSIAIAADLVLAAESASFTVAYTAIGFSTDGGASWTLPRLVGQRRAMELALLNERLTAARALELGIVTRVVPDDSLEAEAEALARKLANGPVGAHAAVKRLLRASSTATFSGQLAEEAHTIAGLAAAPDGREGVLAFLDKRAPHFGEP
jgi:2-(1,2-epoxy-1,2-dihydrophenyl)acetyl-CoA isomerase